MAKIFERVGEEIYSREMGDLTRTIISTGQNITQDMRDRRLWTDIKNLAETHEIFALELQKFLTFYHLCKNEQSTREK